MNINQVADSISSSDKWHFKDLTYSFKSARLPYESDENFQGSSFVSNSMRIATNKIFAYIENLLDISFTYTTGIGDIVLSSKEMYDENLLGYAYYPGSSTKNVAGDVYINSSFTKEDFQVGGVGWSTLVHELGHALGLTHPYDVGDYPGIDINQTVMSYNAYTGYDSFHHYSYDISSFTTYQSADITTLQNYYGANKFTTDDVYDLGQLLYSQKIDGYLGIVIKDNLFTIDDKGGSDIISLENLIGNEKQYLDINSSKQSDLINNEVHHYLTLTKDTLIENVIGSNGDDTIVLNNSNNIVDGLSGFDTVDITNTLKSRVDVWSDKIVVSNKTSGFDILTNIESLQINDTDINLNLYERNTIYVENHDKAVELSRLYLSALDRLADEDGLNYWLDEYENTNNLNAIANSFVISEEFTKLYGQTQSNQEYINLLYNNVLYRDADIPGENYWLEEMQKGFTKADVLVSFSNSDEFITLTSVYFQEDSFIITI